MDPNTPVRNGFAPELPLELIDKILEYFNNDDGDQLENLKKARLISQHWYLTVMDHFLNKVSTKFRTHFDGSSKSYVESFSFGSNIFGNYKLNFGTFKISNSEFYLLRTMLGRLLLDNLQRLELQDNRLTLQQIIVVIGEFKKMSNLKFIETSKSLINTQKLYEIQQNHDENLKGVIQAVVNKIEYFLCGLRTLEVDVIHVNLINLMSAIVSQSRCCKLQSFSIKIKSHQNCDCSNCSNEEDDTKIECLEHFEKHSKMLNKFSVFLDNDCNDQIVQASRDIFSESANFTEIESLAYKDISISLTDHEFMSNFAQFVKNQEKLTNLYIAIVQDVHDPESSIVNDESKIEKFQNFMNNLMMPGKKVRFGYQGSSLGFRPILKLSENVANLCVSHENFNFNDSNVPVFANCYQLTVQGDDHRTFPTQIVGMIRIFPNLTILSLITERYQDQNTREPQLSNEVLQLIFENYPNLEELRFKNCVNHLADSGFTGLTNEALEIRSTNPDLAIEPEERIGLPISTLKKLEVFVLLSPLSPNTNITNMSIRYGFEGMKNLKKVQIKNTNINEEGFELLKEKTGSMKLKTFA